MKSSSNKFRYQYLLKNTLFVLALLLSLSSCEYEINDLHESQANTANPLPFETKSIALKDVPEVENYITSIIGDISQKGKTSKSNAISLDATFEVEKIMETIDTIKNKNYNIRFTFKDTPEHITYNLIVNFLPNGEKHAFVEKHTCNPEQYLAFRDSKYNIKNFKGKVELFYYTSFFGQSKKDSNAKTSKDPCLPQYYPNGDPVPSTSSFVDWSSLVAGTGGSVPSNGFSSSYGSASWPATGGYGLSVQSMGSSSSSSGSSGSSGGGGFGGFFSDLWDTIIEWFTPIPCGCHTQKTTADPCPTIVPVGFATFISEPERLAIIRSQIPLSLEQWQFLHGKDEFMDLLIDYSSRTRNREKVINISQQAIYFIMNNSVKVHSFANYMIKEQIANPNLFFDINASFKSPMNIDLSSIPYDITKPEHQKFNEVYKSLTESPEFQKLFVELFKDSKRFNVKFEIVDNLPRPKKPNEQDNGQTILIPNSTNITIKINKQILTSVTGGIANLSKMAIAKTILHECIHAYLHIKGMYPNSGASIPGIEEMDLQKVINAIYGKDSDQHTFMYENMVKTMQVILSQLKDKLTTEDRRNALVDLKIYTKVDNSAFEIWNWENYFKYLSLSGLSETKIFIKDFPSNSDILRTFNNYNGQGEAYLNKN